MSSVHPGSYLDGDSLVSHRIEATVNSDGTLTIRGENLEQTWPLAELILSSRLGRVPRFLRTPDGGTIELVESDALDLELSPANQSPRTRSWLHRLESHSLAAAVSTVMVAALACSAFWWGLPQLARRAAQAAPRAIELQAGQVSFNIMKNVVAPSQLKAYEKEHVQQQFDRLVQAQAPHLPTKLYFCQMNTPNAFALPNGTIMVTDELVRLAKGRDEIAAVLAHELGHVELRHGLQSVLRNSSALIVVSTLTGDLSALNTFSATLPFLLLQRGYERTFELEADAFSARLMLKAGFDPKGLTSALERLTESRPAAGPDFSYLSTHPSTNERVQKLKAILEDAAKARTESAPH